MFCAVSFLLVKLYLVDPKNKILNVSLHGKHQQKLIPVFHWPYFFFQCNAPLLVLCLSIVVLHFYIDINGKQYK